MDLTETMKQVLAKVSGNAQGLMNSSVNNPAALALLQQHAQQQQQQHHAQQQQQQQHQQQQQSQQQKSHAASDNSAGYVTEKLYMLLQLYLQNKGWNPSVELLQCFSELKDSAMLPSAAYLQVLANRLSLDGQGRLVLRESGKIVLPYEHFANAVMLKHMTGPHGMHLSLEATVRSVVESYTIGRENFGMEKEFILEVVQSCPNPACRYYKSHMGNAVPQSSHGMEPPPPPFPPGPQANMDFLQHISQSGMPSAMANAQAAAAAAAAAANQSNAAGIMDMGQMDANNAVHISSKQKLNNAQQQLQQQQIAALSAAEKHLKQMSSSQSQQQQLTAAMLQQQNRAALAAHQSLDKFNSMASLEKQQRMYKQFDKKQYDAPHLLADSRSHVSERSVQQPRLSSRSPHVMASSSPLDLQQQPKQQQHAHKSSQSQPHNGNWSSYQPPLSAHPPARNEVSTPMPSLTPNPPMPPAAHQPAAHQPVQAPAAHQPPPPPPPQFSMPAPPQAPTPPTIGQENIVRVFDELMKNIARMKMFVRPSMCKPYGKQSESLQKTLMDTIQIVQSLRNCIPAPAIQINTWKNDDRAADTCDDPYSLDVQSMYQRLYDGDIKMYPK